VKDYVDLHAAGGSILGRRITEVITVNGARVHLEDGSWVLVRASSNKPELVVVVESTRSEEDMRALFREEVKPRLGARPEVGAYNQEI
jgi:phosphomannomutase/phosphoglucomutase